MCLGGLASVALYNLMGIRRGTKPRGTQQGGVNREVLGREAHELPIVYILFYADFTGEHCKFFSNLKQARLRDTTSRSLRP